jgi:hypothetical protein
MTNLEHRGFIDPARLRRMLVGAVGGSLVVAAAAGMPAAQAQTIPPGVAVVYPVPSGAPTGEVDVLSLGVADLPVPSLIGSESFVHMRLGAVNRQDDQDWILDARDQLLDLADGRTVEPRYALPGGGSGPPRLVLRKGERGFLDLFFALDGANPSWTSLTWKVRRRAGAEAIVATTVFERLPAYHLDYAHLRPSQYAGGVLWTGPFWCEPRWSGRWLGPYAGYRRYRYTGHPGGFDVFDGRTRWRYERDPVAVAPRESVGTHWRQRAPSAPAVIAHPATTLADPGFERDHVSWRLKIDQVVRRTEGSGTTGGGASGGGASGGWSHVSDSWRARGHSDESSSSRPLSDSSSSTSSSSSSSDSSPSSSSSNSSSSSSGSSSSSSGSSVGSHWRDRR